MKIFVAGATGVLGRRSVQRLVIAGHQVTATARTESKAELLRRLGGTPVRSEVFDAVAVGEAVRGHNVVMNLATHIPPPLKSAFAGSWKENDRIRSELSNILVDAAIAAGAQRYVQESISFMYEDRGDEWIDEDVPLSTPKHVLSMRDAEAASQRFSDAGGVGVVLRFGLFYVADSEQTQLQMRMARRGISPFPGPKDGYISVIHVDDAAGAVVAALDADAGTYNVVDDEPMRRADAAAILAELVGRKRLVSPPSAVLSAGGRAIRSLLRSQRVSNEAFKKASGWEPSSPSVREGLVQVLGEIDG